MKVLTLSAKNVMILALVMILLIVSAIVLIFGRNDKSEEVTPEIEIVLPEGVTG